jgi:prepilin-type N-terminal cleavage/methylation domain-containing protein
MRRAGLTLIELLVVISILLVLVALSAAATIKFIGVQQASNTNTTLVKLQSQLDRQWGEVLRRAKDEPIPDSVRQHPDFVAMIGNDPHASTRARVIYIKLKQRQAFPMSFDEVFNPAPLPTLQPYVVFLRNLGITASTPQTRPYESSICLLIALERSPGEAGVKVEDLGAGTVSAMLSLPGGGQVPYLTDGWDSPLVFCRWPTGCVELNPTGASAGRNDPGDPEGLLNIPDWLATPAANLFRRHCHDLPPRPAAARPSSYKLVPILVSAGPDRKLDLDLRTLAPQGLGATDNLYSSAP